MRRSAPSSVSPAELSLNPPLLSTIRFWVDTRILEPGIRVILARPVVAMVVCAVEDVFTMDPTALTSMAPAALRAPDWPIPPEVTSENNSSETFPLPSLPFALEALNVPSASIAAITSSAVVSPSSMLTVKVLVAGSYSATSLPASPASRFPTKLTDKSLNLSPASSATRSISFSLPVVGLTVPDALAAAPENIKSAPVISSSSPA